MKVQESTLQLCHALATSYYQKATLFGKDPALSLLQAAATCDDFTVTAAVCPFAFSKQKDRQGLALNALNQLPAIPNNQLAHFDAWSREDCANWFFPPSAFRHSTWHELEPENLSDLLKTQGERAHRAILLCTCHPSGYVRQRALDLCAAAGISNGVPFSLIRLNDWVPAVRDAASRGIDHWLANEESPNLLPILPLVSRLSHCYRADHSKILRTMADFLQRGAGQDQLLAGMRDPAASVRAVCYGMATEGGAPETLRCQAIETGLADSLSYLRMRAANQATDFGIEYADRMLANAFMPIRRLGLELHVKGRTVDHRRLLEQGLDDPHRSMREFSRYWLKTLGYRYEFASHYRQTLDDSSAKRSRIALSGLGETGTSEDCLSIAPFLQHTGGRHREAAVRGLAALDFDYYRDSILATVRDSSARVRRAATNTILANRVRLTPSEIMPLLGSIETKRARTHALRLMQKLSKWERIRCLLDAFNECESDGLPQLVDAVHQWLNLYNYSFVEPAPLVLEKVTESFEATQTHLPDQTRKALRGLLESLI